MGWENAQKWSQKDWQKKEGGEGEGDVGCWHGLWTNEFPISNALLSGGLCVEPAQEIIPLFRSPWSPLTFPTEGLLQLNNAREKMPAKRLCQIVVAKPPGHESHVIPNANSNIIASDVMGINDAWPCVSLPCSLHKQRKSRVPSSPCRFEFGKHCC